MEPYQLIFMHHDFPPSPSKDLLFIFIVVTENRVGAFH